MLNIFFAKQEDVNEYAAASRRERRAKVVETPPQKRTKASSQDAIPAEESVPAEEETSAAEKASVNPPQNNAAQDVADNDSDVSFLYLNVGRRDGVRPGEIVKLLAEACELDKAEVGRIRIRDRHTFVGVPADRIEDIVTQLTGKTSHEKELVVEKARAQR